MLVGYAQVSTGEQHFGLQIDAPNPSFPFYR